MIDYLALATSTAEKVDRERYPDIKEFLVAFAPLFVAYGEAPFDDTDEVLDVLLSPEFLRATYRYYSMGCSDVGTKKLPLAVLTAPDPVGKARGLYLDLLIAKQQTYVAGLATQLENAQARLDYLNKLKVAA